MEKFKHWIVAHKVWSIIIASVLVVSIVLAISLPLTLANRHTYSEEWSVNSEYHWHACTDENCDVKANKAKHSFDSDGKCTVCQKSKFIFTVNIGDTPISSDDVVTFQSYWLSVSDSEYLDVGSYYEFEYSKYGADGTTLTFVGEDFPTEAGRYQVKVIFIGDETYLPAEATANFTIAE